MVGSLIGYGTMVIDAVWRAYQYNHVDYIVNHLFAILRNVFTFESS